MCVNTTSFNFGFVHPTTSIVMDDQSILQCWARNVTYILFGLEAPHVPVSQKNTQCRWISLAYHGFLKMSAPNANNSDYVIGLLSY